MAEVKFLGVHIDSQIILNALVFTHMFYSVVVLIAKDKNCYYL